MTKKEREIQIALGALTYGYTAVAEEFSKLVELIK